MLEVLSIFVVVILVIGLCLHHHSLKKQLHCYTAEEAAFVRTAAEHSIMASNTINPVLALMEVTRAVQILESLQQRHGAESLTELTKIDSNRMLRILRNQKERIIQDVIHHTPEFLPSHPLTKEAGFTNN